jgi:hypothetical protein
MNRLLQKQGRVGCLALGTKKGRALRGLSLYRIKLAYFMR